LRVCEQRWWYKSGEVIKNRRKLHLLMRNCIIYTIWIMVLEWLSQEG
jgi:hypothetical protein